MQPEKIQTKIYDIRGQKVMLDFDLAELYETETKYLKRSARANIKRFPPDFMFELSKQEWETLRCNFSTSNSRGGTRYFPFAFTEQGVAMLSGILNSEKAIEVNISIMRAFVFMRQYALTHKDLTEKLHELENKYDKQFKDVYEAIGFLLQKDNQETEQKQRKRIGFKSDETN
ncbi:MAG TPA: ORF6N domain-containing protein [Prolixibacteraceae bacterium]|nr:ORF6N domain-containing protein [Prolixibacteraceae bacterium]